MLDIKTVLGAFVTRLQVIFGLSGLRFWLMAIFLSLCASVASAQSVVLVKSSTPDGSYKAGSSISIQVAFDKAVTVTGRPKLVLETGATDRTANYSGISADGRVLTFVYVVQAGDSSGDLDYVSNTALSLEGKASIKDSMGKSVSVTLPKPGSVGSLSANKAIVVGSSGMGMAVYGSAAAAAGAAVVAKGVIDYIAVPSVAIKAPSATTKASFNAIFSFSEPVKDFSLRDINVVNGKALSLKGDGKEYTAKVRPDGKGDVRIKVAAAVAEDSSGKKNPASESVTVAYDTTAPTVQASAPQVVSSNPFVLELVFSEPVTGDVVSGLTIKNGLYEDLSVDGKYTYGDTSVTGKIFHLTIDPLEADDLDIQFAAGTMKDAAGNGNVAIAPIIIRYDDVRPVMKLYAPKAVTNLEPFPITVAFSEPVMDFSKADIIVINGALGDLVSNDGGINYTTKITPSSESSIEIQIYSMAAHDAALNRISNDQFYSVRYDKTAPSLDISAPQVVANTEEFEVTFFFSEAVTGFQLSDITVVNGSASKLEERWGDVYTAKIKPDGKGALEIKVGDSVAQDVADHGNKAAKSVTIQYDTTVPTLEIVPQQAVVSDMDDFEVTFVFSEPVEGFTLGDITVANGKASDLEEEDDNTYTVEITPYYEHDVEIKVADSVVKNSRGKNNAAARPVKVVYDATEPSVEIQKAPEIVANRNSFEVSFVFSEPVTGFLVGDIDLINGNISDFEGRGKYYTAMITPDGKGDVQINVDYEVAEDVVGNENTAATPVKVLYDDIVPVVRCENKPSGVSKDGSFKMDLSFSEEVNDFTQEDIKVTNGTVSKLDMVWSQKFEVTIASNNGGDVDIKFPAGSVKDSAGNGNTAMGSCLVIYDAIPPTVEIKGAPHAVGNTDDFEVTFAFSEPVWVLSDDEISVWNGELSDLTRIDRSTYKATITPDGGDHEGFDWFNDYGDVEDDENKDDAEDPPELADVAIKVHAGAVCDIACNKNAVSPLVKVDYDVTGPKVTIKETPHATSKQGFVATFEFSEPVNDFSEDEIDLENGAVSEFTVINAAKYKARIKPDGGGDVEIEVDDDSAEDYVGNDSIAAEPVTVIYDDISPTVKIQNLPSIVNSCDAFAVGFVFSEAVDDFVQADVIVGNGEISDFAGQGKHYTAKIKPDGKGKLRIKVAAGAVRDVAGNKNTDILSVKVSYDATPPTVTINKAPSVVTNSDGFDVEFAFSEPMTEFDLKDITVINGEPSELIHKEAGLYGATITPDGKGAVEIKVAADVAKDAAGNGNSAATPVKVDYDVTPPTVEIKSALKAVANKTGFSVDFVFSESVRGFEKGDITVVNGYASGFTKTDDANYKATIIPESEGTVKIKVDAKVAEDFAGHENIEAKPVTVEYDTTPPTVEIQNAPDSVENLNGFIVTFAFLEPVIGFELKDITVTNGKASDFITIDSAKYTAKIKPDGKGNVGIEVDDDVAQDAAGNKNTAATPVTVTYTGPAVVATVKDVPQFVSSLAGFAVIIEFSEPVTGFTPDDIAVGNGNVSDLRSINATSFAAKITPNGQGDITIGLDEAVVKDADGNPNNAVSPIFVALQASGPVANAGTDMEVTSGERVVLDGSGSTDATSEGSVSFEWVQVSGEAVELTDANTDMASFIAPVPAEDEVSETIGFSLVVKDGELSAQDSVEITVKSLAHSNLAASAEVENVDVAGLRKDLSEVISLDASRDLRRGASSSRQRLREARDRMSQPFGVLSGKGGLPGFDGTMRMEGTTLNSVGEVSKVTGSADGLSRTVLSGGFEVQSYGDGTGTQTATGSSQVAWERLLSSQTLVGLFVGSELGYSNLSGRLSGDQKKAGVSIGNYAVHEFGDRAYIDGFMSYGIGRNYVFGRREDVLFKGAYLTRSLKFGSALSAVYDYGTYEFRPEFAVDFGRTGIGSGDFGYVSDGGRDGHFGLDDAAVMYVDTVFRPEVRMSLDGMLMSDSRRGFVFAPRFVCERVTASSVEKSCGGGVELGLDDVSSDGLSVISAGVAGEKIGSTSDASVKLNFSLKY